MAGLHLVVHGRVQGVGFRAYVKSIAEGMDLRGAVWNSRTGTVEVVVEAEEASKLSSFVEAIQHGPGYVGRVDVNRSEINNLGPGFEIRPTI